MWQVDRERRRSRMRNVYMRNAMTVLVISAIGILGVFAYSQTVALRQQRQQVQELTAKLNSASKVASLELQDKCAKQAGVVSPFNPGQRVTNHYNAKLGRCFVLTQSASWGLHPFQDYYTVTRKLTDAFEGKIYAEFAWTRERNGKPQIGIQPSLTPAPPQECVVTLPSGEEGTCKSLDEIDALIKQYME